MTLMRLPLTRDGERRTWNDEPRTPNDEPERRTSNHELCGPIANCLGIRSPMHPAWLRCSSLAYSRYAPSSRLAMRAPRRPRCTRQFATGPLERRLSLDRTNFDVIDPNRAAYLIVELQRGVSTDADVSRRRPSCDIDHSIPDQVSPASARMPASRLSVIKNPAFARRASISGLIA